MWTKTSLLFFFFSVTKMILVHKASPLPEPESPSLSSMLNIFKDGLDISTLLNFIKGYKDFTYILNQAIKTSPLVKSIIETAAKRNVKLRVLMKGAEGKFPDLTDMYDLATTKSRGIYADVNATAAANPKWVEFETLWMKKDTLVNTTELVQVFNLFTGRKLRLKASAIKNLGGGKYEVASNLPIPVKNLLESLLFERENTPHLVGLFDILGSNPGDFKRIIKELASIDFSHFSKISQVPTLADGKYTVTGHAVTDPDVAQILQEVKGLEQMKEPIAPSKAETTFFDIAVRALKVFTRIVQEATGVPTTSDKADKQSRPGVFG